MRLTFNYKNVKCLALIHAFREAAIKFGADIDVTDGMDCNKFGGPRRCEQKCEADGEGETKRVRACCTA